MNRLDLLNGTPYKTAFLGWGSYAIYSTVNKMKRIINHSVANPYVRRWAEKIIADAEVSPDNKIGEITAIYLYIKDNTRYTRDPYDIEYLQSPETTLKLLEYNETPMLDCDDSTMVISALLKVIGFPVALKVASYAPNKQFSHIYTIVYLNGIWIPLDAIKKEFTVGFEIPNITKHYEKRV